MIDIEKIADNIRPKETIYKQIPDTDPDKIFKNRVYQDRPYYRDIFQARDIKDLNKRKEYLLSVIDQENEKDRTPQYVTRPQIILNGKPLTGPEKHLSEKIRLKPIKALINQCEVEIRQVNDLLRIGQIITECQRLGTNERLYFLHYAKEGQVNNEYAPLQFYTPEEFARIVETAASEIPATRPPAGELAADPGAVPIIPTRAVALYFYYVTLSGGQTVRKTNARQLAERFGKTSPNSGNDLYNHYQAIQRDKMERVGISGNANAAKARLSNLQIAIELLRADKNTAAVKLALAELDELKNAYDKRR
ncbi:hypothetical protein [Puia dinghuensis]|uniref:Uncharacterized protein n=1 Tax=Puia dinghuensis TaxID=1792502 RepID=A0A8J2XTS9_9BACT|nr:hypothetical protein [Puia dinghuensis]GGB01844.1 hypothetical protein GCM10011511_26320 [Puia dinghuensis]